MKGITCTVLGSGGSVPSVDRNLPAVYFQTQNCNFLIDMGENTQRLILLNKLPFFMDFIIISHFHMDHYMGLFGYLSTLKLLERKQPLKIYCPEPATLKKILEAVKNNFIKDLNYDLDIVRITPDVQYLQGDLALRFFLVKHSILTFGVQICSQDNTKYDKQKFKKFTQQEVSTLVRDGILVKDQTYHREDFIESTDPYFRVIYSADCLWNPLLLKDLRKTLVFHQCTHLKKEELAMSKETKHTNFVQVYTEETIKTLEKNEIQLVLVHFGARATLNEVKKLQKIAEKRTKNITFSLDSMKIFFEGKSFNTKIL